MAGGGEIGRTTIVLRQTVEVRRAGVPNDLAGFLVLEDDLKDVAEVGNASRSARRWRRHEEHQAPQDGANQCWQRQQACR